MDRRGTGLVSFNPNFVGLSRYEAPLQLNKGELKLQIYFDHSMLEIFANDGEVVMTYQVFPENTNNSIELFIIGTNTVISALRIWTLQSVW